MALGRLRAVLAVCALLGVSIIARAAFIQVVGEERLERLARRQFQSRYNVQPRRGLIVDRNGEAFAVNVDAMSLAANPAKLRANGRAVRALARAIGTPEARIRARLAGASGREFVWIERHLGDEKARRVERLGLDEGFWLVRENKRVYPHADTAAHVVGSVNVDSQGLEGVELWQDGKLRGESVPVSAFRDALGRPSFIDAAAAGKSKDGEPVALTLDASLQFAAELELKDAIARTGASSGTVIVMDAVSGELLVMANQPSFNPNDRASHPGSRRNRALTDGYEPGSTLKPLIYSAALSSGLKPGTLVWGERGRMKIQGRTIGEAEAHERFEWLTLADVVRVSSNIGAAKLALRLGGRKVVDALREFGFGARSGIGFPGEIAGRLPEDRELRKIRVATIGFGQGLLVTPIQMVRAYAALLNGGWLVTPTLLKDPEPSRRPEPRRILDARVADTVVSALTRATAPDGTGSRARLEGYVVAGKTGTSQVVDQRTRRYSSDRYVASFVGFATGVSPKLVIFAALDGPRGSYYGAEVAAPLFRAVLLSAVNRFSIPSGESREADAPPRLAAILDRIKVAPAHPEPAPGAHAKRSLADLARLGRAAAGDGSRPLVAPSLLGLTPREAFRSLEGMDLRVRARGFGMVASQDPLPGALMRPGQEIRLNLR